MGMKRLTVRIEIVFCCFFLISIAAFSQSRIVAIGDVHGAYSEFVAILQKTGLADAKGRWTGGSTVLVQTGDLLDRGARSRECLDLLMELELQAGKQGGSVIPLMGNHDILNMTRNLSYVTPDIYRTFADSRSNKKREQAYRDYVKFLSAHRGHAHTVAAAADESARQKWMDAHPPGFFEYHDALGPRGKYGAWIRTHHAIVKVGDGLFVHGGLNPALQFGSVEELDGRMRSEVVAFDSLWQSLVQKKVIWPYMRLEEAVRQVQEELQWIQAQGNPQTQEGIVKQMRQLLGINAWMINSQEGPLWYRGLAQGKEESLAAALKEMLARLNVRFLVAGHTVPEKFAVTARFENRVFLIDTGMLKETYGGRASALEIQKGRFTAIYADGEPILLKGPDGTVDQESSASDARSPISNLDPESRIPKDINTDRSNKSDLRAESCHPSLPVPGD
jgi:hypothetical protein